MGYMDRRYSKTVREVEEECGILRSGVRLRQEKRKRTEESPGATEKRNHKRTTQGTMRPYNGEGDNQAMPKLEEGPT